MKTLNAKAAEIVQWMDALSDYADAHELDIRFYREFAGISGEKNVGGYECMIVLHDAAAANCQRSRPVIVTMRSVEKRERESRDEFMGRCSDLVAAKVDRARRDAQTKRAKPPAPPAMTADEAIAASKARLAELERTMGVTGH